MMTIGSTNNSIGVSEAIVASPALDLGAIKHRQRQTWASGNFAAAATPMAIVGETLCEAVDLRAGSTVLDVACGSGNATPAAARRFRVVLSTFGVMFAPDRPRAASELLRVCTVGGTIGLANWTPDGMVGAILGITARYAPLPPGLQPPSVRGTEAELRTLLGDEIADLAIKRRQFTLRYPSPDYWLAHFRKHFELVERAFAGLDRDGQEAFAADLLGVLKRFNQADDGTLVAHADSLEVVAVRRWEEIRSFRKASVHLLGADQRLPCKRHWSAAMDCSCP